MIACTGGNGEPVSALALLLAATDVIVDDDDNEDVELIIELVIRLADELTVGMSSDMCSAVSAISEELLLSVWLLAC